MGYPESFKLFIGNGYRVSRYIKDDIEKGLYTKNIIVLLMTAKASHDLDTVGREREFIHADYLMFKHFEIAELMKKVCTFRI